MVLGKVAPVFDLAVGMDPEISGLENILIRGLFLGMTRKQMEARVDDIAAFTELGDYLSMPLRTYSTGMRVRLALGVVTSIDPEILLLDEGIGAVDAEFLAKARDRLNELVERSGILVFASHSDEFLADLCDTAIWMEHGTIREHGPLREVLHHYKGRDVLAELEHAPVTALRSRPASVVAVVVTRHRTEQLVDSLAALAKQTHPIAHLIVVDNGPDEPAREVVEACGLPATWLPSWHNLGGAGGFALGMLHALALGADWVWLADDDGRAADETVLATLVELAERRGLAAVSPTVADVDEPDRLAFPVRRGLTWHRSRAALAADTGTAPTTSCCPASPRCSTARCSGRPRSTWSACRTCGCSSAATRWRCTGGWCARGCRSAPRCAPPTCTRRADDDDKPMLRRPAARPRPRRRGQALLHLPQPRLPDLPAGDAPGRAAGAAPVRLVLPRHQAQPAGVRAVAAAGPPGPRGALPPRLSRSVRKTTVRSITKLITVAVPWAITQASVTRSGIAGSTASISAFMPTLIANVVP